MRWVGERRDAFDALRSDVREREACAADVVRVQRSRAGSGGEADDLALRRGEVEGVGVAHDRDHETVRRIGGDTDRDRPERPSGRRVGPQVGMRTQQTRERKHHVSAPPEIAPRLKERAQRVDTDVRLDLGDGDLRDLGHLPEDRATLRRHVRR